SREGDPDPFAAVRDGIRAHPMVRENPGGGPGPAIRSAGASADRRRSNSIALLRCDRAVTRIAWNQRAVATDRRVASNPIINPTNRIARVQNGHVGRPLPGIPTSMRSRVQLPRDSAPNWKRPWLAYKRDFKTCYVTVPCCPPRWC